jgi:hypothetical protein
VLAAAALLGCDGAAEAADAGGGDTTHDGAHETAVLLLAVALRLDMREWTARARGARPRARAHGA